eukprot:1142631-Pelagomonas_calceolata.AAC.5
MRTRPKVKQVLPEEVWHPHPRLGWSCVAHGLWGMLGWAPGATLWHDVLWLLLPACPQPQQAAREGRPLLNAQSTYAQQLRGGWINYGDSIGVQFQA